LLALDGTKIGADASWSANRTGEQLDTEIAATVKAMLADAARIDAGEDAMFGDGRGDQVPMQLAERTSRLARLREARDRLALEDAARRAAQQAKLEAWQARKDAAGPRRAGRRPSAEPSGNKRGTQPRANTTDPQARVVRTKNTLIVGYNAQAVVTIGQVIVGATVFQKEVDGTLLHPTLQVCRRQLSAAGVRLKLTTVVADSATSAKPRSPRPTPRSCACSHRSPKTPEPCATVATRPRAGICATSPRPPVDNAACATTAAAPITASAAAPSSRYSGNSRPAST
jgi:hypothetical protein